MCLIVSQPLTNSMCAQTKVVKHQHNLFQHPPLHSTSFSMPHHRKNYILEDRKVEVTSLEKAVMR